MGLSANQDKEVQDLGIASSKPGIVYENTLDMLIT